MPGRIRRKRLPGFEGVGPNQTATLRIPRGPSYHAIVINYGATAAGLLSTMADEIRVLINSKDLIRYDVTELEKMNAYDNATTVAATAGNQDGFIIIPFDRLNMATRPNREMTAIGTHPKGSKVLVGDPPVLADDPYPVQTLSLEIDTKAGAAGIMLRAWALQSAPAATDLVKKISRSEHPLVNGETEINTFPLGDAINRIFLMPGNASITNVQLVMDDVTIWDVIPGLDKFMMDIGQFRTYQSNMYVLDPTVEGFGSDMIPTAGVADFRLRVTANAAVASCPIYVEFVGPIILG